MINNSKTLYEESERKEKHNEKSKTLMDCKFIGHNLCCPDLDELQLCGDKPA